MNVSRSKTHIVVQLPKMQDNGLFLQLLRAFHSVLERNVFIIHHLLLRARFREWRCCIEYGKVV